MLPKNIGARDAVAFLLDFVFHFAAQRRFSERRRQQRFNDLLIDGDDDGTNLPEHKLDAADNHYYYYYYQVLRGVCWAPIIIWCLFVVIPVSFFVSVSRSLEPLKSHTC